MASDVEPFLVFFCTKSLIETSIYISDINPLAAHACNVSLIAFRFVFLIHKNTSLPNGQLLLLYITLYANYIILEVLILVEVFLHSEPEARSS
jgi:hypothetical protein